MDSGIAAKVNGLTLARYFGTICDYLKGLGNLSSPRVGQFLKLTHLATNMESNPRNSDEQNFTVFSPCGYEYRRFTSCPVRRAEAGWLHWKFCAYVSLFVATKFFIYFFFFAVWLRRVSLKGPHPDKMSLHQFLLEPITCHAWNRDRTRRSQFVPPVSQFVPPVSQFIRGSRSHHGSEDFGRTHFALCLKKCSLLPHEVQLSTKNCSVVPCPSCSLPLFTCASLSVRNCHQPQ